MNEINFNVVANVGMIYFICKQIIPFIFMTPHKELTDRIKKLTSTDVTAYQIFAEAQVLYQNYYNWEKDESPQVVRWYALLAGLRVNPWSLAPGSSTYNTVKQRKVTRAEAIKEFMKYGFARITVVDWARKGDPSYIEALKRVNHVVTKYEHYRQKAVTVS